MITTAAHKDSLTVWDPYAVNGGYGVNYVREGVPYADGFSPEIAQPETLETVVAPPQTGQAQLWRILSELAPLQPVDVSLTTLLRTSQSLLGNGRTVVVITPQVDPVDQPVSVVTAVSDGSKNGADLSDGEESSWAAELVHVQTRSTGTVLLIAPGEPHDRDGRVPENSSSARGREEAKEEPIQSSAKPADRTDGQGDSDGSTDAALRWVENLLAQYDIPVRTFYSGQHLPTLLTHTRTRRIVRNTPTGGAVSVEIEEEVG